MRSNYWLPAWTKCAKSFASRNKTTFAAIGAAMGALVIGLALSLYLFTRERAARQRAVAAEQEQTRIAEWGEKLGRAGMLLTRNQFDEAERLISDIPPHSS